MNKYVRIGLAAMAAVLATGGCMPETRGIGLPADDPKKWAEVPDLPELPGDTNIEQHRMDRAQEILGEFGKRLPNKKPDELIRMFSTSHVYGGVAYYVGRDGNTMIKWELRSRGDTAREALEANRNDPTPIFTGANGPYETVGDICQSLLDRLQEKNATRE